MMIRFILWLFFTSYRTWIAEATSQHDFLYGIQFKIRKANVLKDEQMIIKQATNTIAKFSSEYVRVGRKVTKPLRIFRHAGKHEEEHVAFGLHLWHRLFVARDSAQAPTSTEIQDSLSERDALIKALLDHHILSKLLEHVRDCLWACLTHAY